jgi:dephospho-CoA kinase
MPRSDEPSPSQRLPWAAGQPLRLGLTGNIAAGKGEVARLLAAKGCVIVDADAVAHDLYRLRPDLVGEIAMHFGPDMLTETGELNRKTLGDLVFANPEALATLNALVRPALHAELEKRITEATSQGHDVVLDAALIIEWGWDSSFNALWLVGCSEDLRIERLQKRNHLTLEQARRRVAGQMPEANKRPYADIVLMNEGGREALAEQVEAAWMVLQELRAR